MTTEQSGIRAPSTTGAQGLARRRRNARWMLPGPLRFGFVAFVRRARRALRMVEYDLLWGKRSGRVSIGPGVRFDPQMDLSLGRSVWLSQNGVLQGPGRLRIGRNTYLGANFSIHCAGSVEIGADCLFGNFVSVVDNDHESDAAKPVREQPLRPRPVRIGNDVWIGEKATVLRGVTIGDHAIVASGALVRSDVPPWAIVAGVPARVIRLREGAPNGLAGLPAL